MQNRSLVKDYLIRSKSRLRALDVLFSDNNWPDVVRESQEIVELALKALIQSCNIEIPRIHDVSDILSENKNILPATLKEHCEKMCDISRELRRDRELSFYGSEDLTPSEFYKEKDAKHAKENAQWLVDIITKTLQII